MPAMAKYIIIVGNVSLYGAGAFWQSKIYGIVSSSYNISVMSANTKHLKDKSSL